jgi:hypothetical protein
MTGALAHPLGAAATPSITFTGDTNTGIYSPGADQVAISTNGAGKLFINSAGDIGIGAAPSGGYKLEVKGGATDSVAIFDSTNAVGPHLRFSTSGTDRHYLGSAPGFTASGTSSDFAIRTAGYLALSTGGNNERLRITSDGKLGLGTSSPSELLHLESSADNGVYIIKTGNGLSGFYRTTNGAVIRSGAGNPSLKSIIFQTSDGSTHTEVGRFDSSGRLGIGTSPDRVLHAYSTSVNAVAKFQSTQNYSTVEFISAVNTNSVTMGSDGAGNGYIENKDTSKAINFVTGGSERARIDSSGRLLVGTSTGAAFTAGSTGVYTPYLQISGGGGAAEDKSSLALVQYNQGGTGRCPGLFLGKSRSSSIAQGLVLNGEALGEISFQGSDGSNFIRAAQIRADVDGTPGTNDMPCRLVFSTTADGASSPTERMRIRNNGDVLIGTTAELDVGSGTDDGIRFVQAKGAGGIFQASNDSNVVAYLRRRGTNGTIFQFHKDTTSVGTISVTASATAYNTSSDYRLKENVVPLTGAADRLNQLQVHRFNFIAEPNKTVDGFIAHEAQAVVPECVTGTKDEVDADGNPVYQGIDQSKLVPLLTAALQEALAEIESLKARLTAAGI